MKIDDLSLPLKGKCHCGSVRFEVSTNIKNLRRCNCSICSRKGFVMGTALLEELTITKGKEYLTSYKWNTKVAEHPRMRLQNREGTECANVEDHIEY